MDTEKRVLNRSDIEHVLPHRRPFMFLESAEIIEPGRRAVGQLADLSHPDFNFLKGHFPGFQVVPGVILMEALAELLGIAAVAEASNHGSKIGFLAAYEMRHRQMVKPGDQVLLEAEVATKRRNIITGSVKALREGKIVVEGKITFALRQPTFPPKARNS